MEISGGLGCGSLVALSVAASSSPATVDVSTTFCAFDSANGVISPTAVGFSVGGVTVAPSSLPFLASASTLGSGVVFASSVAGVTGDNCAVWKPSVIADFGSSVDDSGLDEKGIAKLKGPSISELEASVGESAGEPGRGIDLGDNGCSRTGTGAGAAVLF